jgi:release factor glutamine methyltransferase
MTNLLIVLVMLPSIEIRAILNHVVGCYIGLEDCNEKQRVLVERLIKKRLTGMPLAKIIGYKEFWKHRFITTEDTLDPRPDSETLIEAVLKTCPVKPYRILDLGTGTGCLLISLLEEYPDATGVGVDVCEKALRIAKRNASVILLASRCSFIQSNWCENLSGVFDIIISNPPYINPSEPIDKGASFDPSLALYGGVYTYESILQSIDQHLERRPQDLFFEIGHAQAEVVSQLLKRYSYRNIQLFKDLAGKDRVLHASTPIRCVCT